MKSIQKSTRLLQEVFDFIEKEGEGTNFNEKLNNLILKYKQGVLPYKRRIDELNKQIKDRKKRLDKMEKCIQEVKKETWY